MPLTRKIRYLFEAAGFFLIIGFFRLFGIDRASAIGGWMGRNLAILSRSTGLARENLRAAFPEKPQDEIETIIRRMWDNLGRVLAEYAHLDKIHMTGENARITVSGLENTPSLERQTHGALLISAHFANWEILPTAARDYGLTGATIVRPTNNPYVNRWLDRARRRNGMPELISKGADGMRRVYTLLREGKCICLLVDQRASEGIQVPFFGRDAQTTPAPAALALRLGALIVPFSNERVSGAHFHVRLHPVIEQPNTGDTDRDIVAYTTAINAFVEECVRARPEQWLWIHRRWVDADAPLRRRAQALSSRGAATNATSNRV